MKKTIFRLYYVWQWEKEEQWLNSMSQKGWQLVHASFGKFKFESGEPSEYTYRLEMLENGLHSKESTSYLNFLNETGIEMVGKCKSWIYLRSKTANSGFGPNNKSLYDLTHLLKVQNLSNFIRNTMLAMITVVICTLLIMPYIDSSFWKDFLRGFCVGLSLSTSLYTMLMIPFTKRNNEKIKNAIKELYTIE